MSPIFTQEELKKFNEEHKIHDSNFQQFHKQIFKEMKEKAFFMACRILDKDGKKPSDENFVEELSKLSTDILSEKIKLLGSYLQK